MVEEVASLAIFTAYSNIAIHNGTWMEFRYVDFPAMPEL